MTRTPADPLPLPAFAELAFEATEGGGVTLCERGLGMATLLVRKGRRAELARCLLECWGIELPTGPRCATAGELSLIGTGPGAWLALHRQDGRAFLPALRQTIGDLASISDQSDGYAVLRLAGPKVREALAKLVPIDLHPGAFPVGHAAGTVASHIGVILWRLPDAADGSAVFQVAVYRSFAASFWHALTASAAEFGMSIATPRCV